MWPITTIYAIRFILRHYLLTSRIYQIVNLLWISPLLFLMPLTNIRPATGSIH